MIFLYIALVWFMGFGVVRLLFPGPPRWSLHTVFLLSLGAGVGIGIASCLYFLCLSLAGPKLIVLASVEGAALALTIVGCAITWKRSGVTLEWARGPVVPWYLTGLLLLAVASAATMLVVYTLNKPHGEWDAWAIWNLRARFFERGGDVWRNAFSNQLAWSHPDYPLLLPGIVAMCWTLAKVESTNAPVAIAFLFTLGTAGLLISTLGILRGKAQAFIGGILLLGTASFVENGANQYADIPLSFFMLASLALFCIQDRYPDKPGIGILAGAMAGFAAWTKNEGLMFLLVLIVARAIAIFRYGNRSLWMPQFLRIAGGVVPPLAVVAFFKLRFAPSNEFMAKPARDIIHHAADVGRWITALEGFLRAPFVVGGFLIPIAVLMAVYWYLVRFKVEERDRLSLATLLIALCLMLAGDFAVYLLFPGDVVWQMNTSMERLFLQVWPAGLLAFFLAANPPQLVRAPVMAEKSKPSKRASKQGRKAAETR